MEITLDITPPQLVSALQSLSKPSLQSVILDSLNNESIDDSFVLDVVTGILDQLLVVYTDELETYTQRQIEGVFGANGPTAINNDLIQECEHYVKTTENAIEAIQIIRDGPCQQFA
jgi:hypothetical protein